MHTSLRISILIYSRKYALYYRCNYRYRQPIRLYLPQKVIEPNYQLFYSCKPTPVATEPLKQPATPASQGADLE